MQITLHSNWIWEKKIEKIENCGSFSFLWLWLLIAIMKRCSEQCALQLYCTSLMYIHSKSKVTKTFLIFKNGTKTPKALFLIKHSLLKKIITWQDLPNLVSGHFIQVFYKMTTFPRQPLLSGLKSGCLI